MPEDRLPPEIADLAAELTEVDRQRLTPPPEIWAGIEAAIGDEPAPVVDLRDRRRPAGRAILALAAAALVVLGFVGGLVVTGNGNDDGSLLAATTITNEGLPVANDEAGEARLIEVDGRLEIELDVPDLPSTEGFYELWVIDTDVVGMQSLGIVSGDGRFVVPHGVDPADFPVVDVSVEPVDGDPTHSGQSIWRGVLDV